MDDDGIFKNSRFYIISVPDKAKLVRHVKEKRSAKVQTSHRIISATLLPLHS